VEALVARDRARLERVVDIFFENGAGLRTSVISRLGSTSHTPAKETRTPLKRERLAVGPTLRRAAVLS
jgi:hypothetical protein